MTNVAGTASPGALMREAVLSVLSDPVNGWNAAQAAHAEILGLGSGYGIDFGSPRQVIRALVNPNSPVLSQLTADLSLAVAANGARNTGRATMACRFNGDVGVALQFLFRHRAGSVDLGSIDATVDRGELVADLVEGTCLAVFNRKALNWQQYGNIAYADRIETRRFPSVPYGDGWAVATTVTLQFEVTL